jgi:hypothetical protein
VVVLLGDPAAARTDAVSPGIVISKGYAASTEEEGTSLNTVE